MAAGLSQVRLAEKSGYYVNYLRKLERGERRPSRQVTGALTEALDLSPADRSLFERVARTGALPEPAMVGRDAELAIVEGHLDGDQHGLLMLSGEPGIGKTRLLAAAKHLADERGMLTLEARCRSESEISFGPVREALERPLWAMRPEERIRYLAGCERLSRLIAETIGVTFQLHPILSPEEEQEQVFGAVSRFLARLAAGREIVLLIDDMHLVDGDTLDLLGRLLWLSELPFYVIGTCRDTYPDVSQALDDTLAELVAAGMAHEVPLGPLSPVHAETLLDELLAEEVAPEQRQRLIERSGGIPDLMISLAAGPLDGPVPDDVQEEILARVHALPEAGQEILEIVAVAGGAAPEWLIQCVSRQPQDDLFEGLEAAAAANLVQLHDGDTYACRCDAITESVTRSTPASRRETLGSRVTGARKQLDRAASVDAVPQGTVVALPPAEQPSSVTPIPAEGWCVGR
jgi:hypothetical protein